MTDPDVTPVGFGATDGPGALVRRHRNAVWLVLCVVLAIAGATGIGVFAASFAGIDVTGDAVASGRVAALDGPPEPAARFQSPEQQSYTVWMSTAGISTSLDRERVVAATNCSVAFAAGGSTRFRGAGQGSAVSLGVNSTVGVVAVPAGQAEVVCQQEPFGALSGRDLLRETRAFYVVPGKPGAGWQKWVILFVGIGALVLAYPVGSRWWQGSLRRR